MFDVVIGDGFVKVVEGVEGQIRWVEECRWSDDDMSSLSDVRDSQSSTHRITQVVAYRPSANHVPNKESADEDPGCSLVKIGDSSSSLRVVHPSLPNMTGPGMLKSILLPFVARMVLSD